MALTGFAPALWWGEVFTRLRKALVHGAIADRQYEGVLSFGDRLKISEISAVDVSDYTKRSDITWQEPDEAAKWLIIDTQEYSAVDLEDIEATQARADLRTALTDEMGYALADAVDVNLATTYSQAGNSVTAATVSAGNVLENISDFAEALDEGKAFGARFMPIPPFYHNYALQAATGIIGHTGVPKVASDGMLTNGMIGELFGINLLLSHNVNGTYNMMAMTRQALALVMQLGEIETIRREDRFATGVRALNLYGYKVVRPEAMASCVVTKG